MSYDAPSDRYRRDPEFATLVDLIRGWIHRCQYTPTEVREAAMLAAIIEAQRSPGGPWTVTREEAERWGIRITPTSLQGGDRRYPGRRGAVLRSALGGLVRVPVSLESADHVGVEAAPVGIGGDLEVVAQGGGESDRDGDVRGLLGGHGYKVPPPTLGVKPVRK